MPANWLAGVALVTGGAAGIGASTACELTAAGMRVAEGMIARADESAANDLDAIRLRC